MFCFKLVLYIDFTILLINQQLQLHLSQLKINVIHLFDWLNLNYYADYHQNYHLIIPKNLITDLFM